MKEAKSYVRIGLIALAGVVLSYLAFQQTQAQDRKRDTRDRVVREDGQLQDTRLRTADEQGDEATKRGDRFQPPAGEPVQGGMVNLNEIRIDQTATDVAEFFEVSGPP